MINRHLRLLEVIAILGPPMKWTNRSAPQSHRVGKEIEEEFKEAEASLVRLATFPEQNPNPVIETRSRLGHGQQDVVDSFGRYLGPDRN